MILGSMYLLEDFSTKPALQFYQYSIAFFPY
jgi:hypothetical protein